MECLTAWTWTGVLQIYVLFPCMCTPAWIEKKSLCRYSLSCLSVGIFVLKASMVIFIHGYCWWDFLFLLICQPSLLSSVQDLLSRLTHAVQQVHDLGSFFPTRISYLSSHSTLISQPCFPWLSWNLSLRRCTSTFTAGFATCLLDWFLRISPKTNSVLNTFRVK